MAVAFSLRCTVQTTHTCNDTHMLPVTCMWADWTRPSKWNVSHEAEVWQEMKRKRERGQQSRLYRVISSLLLFSSHGCVSVSLWQNVVLETSTVAGAATEAALTNLAGVCTVCLSVDWFGVYDGTTQPSGVQESECVELRVGTWAWPHGSQSQTCWRALL